MTFVILKNKDEILEQLEYFRDVFPNLVNRVKSLDAYADKLSQYATCVLIKQANDSIGFAAFYANDQETKTGYIASIGVKSIFQGHGFGKALMQYCCEQMKMKSMNLVKLEVNKQNMKARKFYEHLGFYYLPENVQGGGTSVFMIKNIK